MILQIICHLMTLEIFKFACHFGKKQQQKHTQTCQLIVIHNIFEKYYIPVKGYKPNTMCKLLSYWAFFTFCTVTASTTAGAARATRLASVVIAQNAIECDLATVCVLGHLGCQEWSTDPERILTEFNKFVGV